jgi:hypothetical protein
MRTKLQKAAVWLLALTSLLSVLLFWRSTIGLERGAEALDAWEARLAPVRAALPIERGVIGYVGEWDVPGAEYSFWDQESEYLLAQYALAPLIVVKGPGAEWNVAVLSPKSFDIWQSSHAGEFEVTRLKHNVYILHRRAAP